MTLRLLALTAAGAALLLPGCGTESATPEPTPPSSTYTVTVLVQHQHGGDVVYTEGAVPEIRLVAADGSELLPQEDHGDVATFEEVPGGEYTLTGASRPCDGNCGLLDPATDLCRTELTVDRDRRIVVEMQAGQPCVFAGFGQRGQQ